MNKPTAVVRAKVMNNEPPIYPISFSEMNFARMEPVATAIPEIHVRHRFLRLLVIE